MIIARMIKNIHNQKSRRDGIIVTAIHELPKNQYKKLPTFCRGVSPYALLSRHYERSEGISKEVNSE
jgi:hypothetical protein